MLYLIQELRLFVDSPIQLVSAGQNEKTFKGLKHCGKASYFGSALLGLGTIFI
jgi:hypothetical protein